MHATRIKELRARYDLRQEDLARKAGVRRETILYLEKGKYNSSLELAHEVARVRACRRRYTLFLKLLP